MTEKESIDIDIAREMANVVGTGWRAGYNYAKMDIET